MVLWDKRIIMKHHIRSLPHHDLFLGFSVRLVPWLTGRTQFARYAAHTVVDIIRKWLNLFSDFIFYLLVICWDNKFNHFLCDRGLPASSLHSSASSSTIIKEKETDTRRRPGAFSHWVTKEGGRTPHEWQGWKNLSNPILYPLGEGTGPFGPIIPLLLLLVNAVNGWSHPILISLSFLSLSVSEMRDETTRSLRSLNLWWKDEERLSIPWRDRPSSAHPSSRYTLLSSATRRVTSVVRSEWGADGERVTTIPSHSLPTHDGLFLHFTSLRVERPSWVRQRSGVNEEGTVRVMEAGIRLTFTTRHPSAPLLGVESRSLRVTRKERWRKGITIVPPEPATHALSVYNPFCLNCWVRLKDPEDPR